jgi:catechol 2,3-dioxygenase-like lactoylglutathione lyase family enzyme
MARRAASGQSVRMDDRPVFDQINLVVRDMPAMLAFYQLLGLDVADPDPGWEGHHRTTTAGDGIDIDLDSQPFAQRWNRGWPADMTGPVIGFRVAERSTVDELFQRLRSAGYEGQQEPYDAFWGARYAVVSDPEGNAVGIMSTADPSRRSRPTPPAS